MNFEENISTLRKKSGLTQKQFADKLNLSATTVTAWEKGAKKPSYEVLLLIGKQFNVSLDWLCGNSTSAQVEVNTWADIIKMLSAVVSCEKIPNTISFNSRGEIEQCSLSFSKYLLDNELYNFGTSSPRPDRKYIECSEPEQSTSEELFTIDNPLYEFFSQYDKMKKLLDQEAIDREIFDMWLSKCFEKYDYEIINDCLIEGEPNGNDNKTE